MQNGEVALALLPMSGARSCTLRKPNTETIRSHKQPFCVVLCCVVLCVWRLRWCVIAAIVVGAGGDGIVDVGRGRLIYLLLDLGLDIVNYGPLLLQVILGLGLDTVDHVPLLLSLQYA